MAKRIRKDRFSDESRQDFLVPVQAVNPSALKDLKSLFNSDDLSRELANFDMQVGSNSMDLLQTSSLPKKTRDRILKAQYWYETDDLLNNLVTIKQDFTTLGLSFRVASEKAIVFENEAEIEEGADPEVSSGKLSSEELTEMNEQSEFQKKLNRVFRKWDWEAVIADLVRDWYVTDSMILYWKLDTPDTKVIDQDGMTNDVGSGEPRSKEALMPGVAAILALNPSHVDWDNSYGNDTLLYRIPDPIKEKIRAVLALRNPQAQNAGMAALYEAGITDDWINAIKAGKESVALKWEEGDRWIIRTRARKNSGLASPSMYTVFLALEVRKALEEGDMAAAYLMKHFILHVTVGESVNQGPMAGTRNNWAKPKEIKSVFNTIKTTNKAQRMVTNHTVKFNFVYPPEEMWSLKKFNNCENRIYNWAGVNVVIATGEGGTNASGFLGAKRMIGSMGKCRRQVKHVVTEFFDDEEIRAIMGTPEDVLVNTTFDENALKDPRMLLDELKFMVTEGFGDPQQATRELGRDPESIAMSKAESIQKNRKTKIYEPIYVQSFGGFGNDQEVQSKPGRPPKPGTEPNDKTRNPEDTIK
jgi:hypothetical protein